MEKITYTINAYDFDKYIAIEVKYSNGDRVDTRLSKDAHPGKHMDIEIGRWCDRNGIDPRDIHPV